MPADFPNYVVTGIRDVDIPRAVNGDAGRTGESDIAIPQKCAKHAAGKLADEIVALIGDIHVSGVVYRDAGRVRKGDEAGAGDCDHQAARYLPDEVVALVRDIHVSGGVHRHSYRPAETMRRGDPVAIKIERAVDARKSGNDAAAHLVHDAVALVGDVNVPGRGGRHSGWAPHRRIRCRGAVHGRAWRAVSREYTQLSRRVHLENA